jgi:hypothetical protein
MLHKQNRMPLPIDTNYRVETFHIKSNVDVKQELIIEDGRASTHAIVPFVSGRSFLLLLQKKNRMPLPIDTIKSNVDVPFVSGNRSFLFLLDKKSRMPLPIDTTNVDVEDGRASTLATITRDLDLVLSGFIKDKPRLHSYSASSSPILKSFETILPGWTKGSVVIKRKKLSTISTSAPTNFRIDFFIVLIVIVITVSLVIFIVIVIMSPRETVSDLSTTSSSY